MEAVYPTLRNGLVNVCEDQPGDPIDHLAAYLFKHGDKLPASKRVPQFHEHDHSHHGSKSGEGKE